MGTLIKTIGVNYTPASPGSPGSPGKPAFPAYWTRTCVYRKNCVPFAVGSTIIVVKNKPSLLLINGSVCDWAYSETRYSKEPQLKVEEPCSVQYHGPVAAVLPIAAVAPTPAQTTVLFYPGWNASGMSIPGVLVGKGAAFTVKNGSMGVLACLAPAAWTPNIVTTQFGIMFQAGGFSGQPSSVTAMVWENGAPVQPLGTFINGQTFVIGRSLDNRIAYWNQTQNIMVTRPKAVLPPPTVPMRLVAQLYYGGDACAA